MHSFCDMYFVFGCAENRTLLFLCDLSHQQRNNISGLNSVSSQCERGKSFIVRKPEVHFKTFKNYSKI